MALTRKFTDIKLSALRDLAQDKYDTGWRAVQTHCVSSTHGINIVYTFERDGVYDNYVIHGLQKDDEVPSLQDLFLGLFPFENEAHDLFGVNVTGMILDFQGNFYDLTVKAPMTIVSPQTKARREQAAKLEKLTAERDAKAAAKRAAAQAKVAPAIAAAEASAEATIAAAEARAAAAKAAAEAREAATIAAAEARAAAAKAEAEARAVAEVKGLAKKAAAKARAEAEAKAAPAIAEAERRAEAAREAAAKAAAMAKEAAAKAAVAKVAAQEATGGSGIPPEKVRPATTNPVEQPTDEEKGE